MSNPENVIPPPAPRVVKAAPPPLPERARAGVPVGPRLEALIAIAYRARRPVLLEGPTGIGKSEIIAEVARKLGIATVVLDLSLLEPPDLVGLPVVQGGRTVYATPDRLPQGGSGILVLEELNRAERYMQQPALQLLTARELHGYRLPDGWSCVAAINPDDGEYQVSAMDPALRSRFLSLRVRASRDAWIPWAEAHAVHPAVLRIARDHDRVFDAVSPRTWTYVSDLLPAMTPAERADLTVVRQILTGYLPAAWIEVVLSLPETQAGSLEVDVRELMATYAPGCREQSQIRGYLAEGRVDRIDEIVQRLLPIVTDPALARFQIESFETLLGDLPGDHRETLQEAFANNIRADGLIGMSVSDLWQDDPSVPERLDAWRRDPRKHHRLAVLVKRTCDWIGEQGDALRLWRDWRACERVRRIAQMLGEPWGHDLTDALVRAGIAPVVSTSVGQA
jgi:hypothetical protein